MLSVFFCPRYRIYEYVDGYMKLDYLGDFRNTCYRGSYRMFFSPVINAMENGRFIFSPLIYAREPWLKTEPWSFDAIEVWEKNTPVILIRSPLELPINFTWGVQSLWIVQL